MCVNIKLGIHSFCLELSYTTTNQTNVQLILCPKCVNDIVWLMGKHCWSQSWGGSSSAGSFAFSTPGSPCAQRWLNPPALPLLNLSYFECLYSMFCYYLASTGRDWIIYLLSPPVSFSSAQCLSHFNVLRNHLGSCWNANCYSAGIEWMESEMLHF